MPRFNAPWMLWPRRHAGSRVRLAEVGNENFSPHEWRGVRRACSLFLLSLVIVIASPALRAQGSAVRVETFSLKPNGEVIVENPRGATRVESWDYQTVRVVAEKKGPAATQIDPGELVLMGALNSVILQCKQGQGIIDLTLYVPHNARLQVTGGGHLIEINGSLAGAVVDTTSGSISYRLPANDDARVSMRSARGTVRSTASLTAVERIGSRSIQGQLGSGSAQVILSSQTGNVTLTPGPTLSAVARVSTNDRVAAGAQPRAGSSADSETAGQTAINQRAGGSSIGDQRDPIQPNQTDVMDPAATKQGVQSNGSVSLAGSDRSSDSSMTHTSGPFNRPRTERNTSGGNSGLKARIIPSDPSPRRSPDAAGSVFDQPSDDQDPRSTSQPPTGHSGGGTSSARYPSSGSVVFGGSDQSSDSSGSARIGPLERDRQARDTTGGNSGLRGENYPINASELAARYKQSLRAA